MASLRDLKRRIRSVEGIRQITRAMQMVAATKLRRAQQRIESARPYSEKMDDILSHLSQVVSSGGISHPLMNKREPVRRVLIVAIGSDKGLGGSYTANVIRRVESYTVQLEKEGKEVALLLIGRKLVDYFTRRTSRDVIPDSEYYRIIDQKLPVTLLQDLTKLIIDLYDGKYKTPQGKWVLPFDRVELVFTEARSVVSHKVAQAQFLPIVGLVSKDSGKLTKKVRDYIFEPNAKKLISALIPKYARVIIFKMLAESLASEHGSRMAAMRNATENAADMITTLTLQRNKARQAAITKELAEIVGGAEALRG
jgi:F-type H+-transporting ATPase subunit gamma